MLLSATRPRVALCGTACVLVGWRTPGAGRGGRASVAGAGAGCGGYQLRLRGSLAMAMRRSTVGGSADVHFSGSWRSPRAARLRPTCAHVPRRGPPARNRAGFSSFVCPPRFLAVGCGLRHGPVGSGGAWLRMAPHGGGVRWRPERVAADAGLGCARRRQRPRGVCWWAVVCRQPADAPAGICGTWGSAKSTAGWVSLRVDTGRDGEDEDPYIYV